MNVSNSVFLNNSSLDVTGGIYYYGTSGTVLNNTFYGNSSPGDHGASILIQDSYGVTVTGNIIAMIPSSAILRRGTSR